MRNIFCFLLILTVSFSFGQNREKAFQINNRLGKGINFGNMFEAPSETEWGNPWKPEYARIISNLGFNHIRIPIRWEPTSRTSLTEPYTINVTFLNRIKMVVDSALKNKLHVIINMHHHDSLLANPDKQKPRFLAQWKQISSFFKNYPDSLLFEILNEPNGKITPEKWNVFSKDALAKIREDNPTRVVLLGTAEWGGLGGLPYLSLPNDNNIILTLHYYNPFTFTHQGASWVGTEANGWLGTKWLDTDVEREVVKQEFAPLYQFGKSNNIPVHIGEFGAYNTADIKSRAKWTTYIARYCESLGWSWAYWEFSAGFGIFDPVKKSYNAPLIEALILNKLPEPATYASTPVYVSNFQTSTDGWVISNQGSAKSALSRINNSLKATIDDGSAESWHVQLNKGSIKLETGKKYRFSFKAKAETARTISAYVGMNVSPWSSYSGYNSISLADTFTVYSVVFDMKTSDNTARITFDMGKSVSDVTFTEIKLETLTFTPPTNASVLNLSKTKIYPNPVTSYLKLQNISDFENCFIFDSNGKKVMQMKLESNVHSFPVNGLQKGIYLLTLSGKKSWHSEKFLKQ